MTKCQHQILGSLVLWWSQELGKQGCHRIHWLFNSSLWSLILQNHKFSSSDSYQWECYRAWCLNGEQINNEYDLAHTRSTWILVWLPSQSSLHVFSNKIKSLLFQDTPSLYKYGYQTRNTQTFRQHLDVKSSSRSRSLVSPSELCIHLQ